MNETVRYEYRMVQLPQTFILKQDTGKEIAAYLEKLASDWGAQGWEFYRIDEVGVAVQPGCFAALGGAKASIVTYNVMSFRRPKPSTTVS
jgi:hypothetical protein